MCLGFWLVVQLLCSRQVWDASQTMAVHRGGPGEQQEPAPRAAYKGRNSRIHTLLTQPQMHGGYKQSTVMGATCAAKQRVPGSLDVCISCYVASVAHTVSDTSCYHTSCNLITAAVLQQCGCNFLLNCTAHTIPTKLAACERACQHVEQGSSLLEWRTFG